MTPQPGDFGLLVGNDPVGRLIRLAEWLNGSGFSQYSHAVLALDDGTLIEAEAGGARIRPVTEYPANLIVWSSWTLSDAQRSAIVAAGRRYVGTPYSALDYFALVARRLHVPAPGLRRYVASTGHMICSQLVAQSYTDAALPMFADGRTPGDVTPADLGAVLTGPRAVTR